MRTGRTPSSRVTPRPLAAGRASPRCPPRRRLGVPGGRKRPVSADLTRQECARPAPRGRPGPPLGSLGTLGARAALPFPDRGPSGARQPRPQGRRLGSGARTSAPRGGGPIPRRPSAGRPQPRRGTFSAGARAAGGTAAGGRFPQLPLATPAGRLQPEAGAAMAILPASPAGPAPLPTPAPPGARPAS